MKTKLYSTLLALLLTMAVVAQPPQMFKYQGVVRDHNGNLFNNKNISFRISLVQGSALGTAVYIETQNTNTNQFGLFNINVGAGSVITGNFSTIPWSQNNYFQKVEIDTTGGSNFILMGTSQILSVPYALAADTANISKYVLYNGFTDFFVFDTPGTFNTFTAGGERNYMIEVWGGGGGGGTYFAEGYGYYGMSGGGGGYGKSIFHLHAGDRFIVTVGAGGWGATGAEGGDGGHGGTSSFGSLIYATGGIGGSFLTSYYSSGGTSNGSINISGGKGRLEGGNSQNGGSGGVYAINGEDGIAPGGGGSYWDDNGSGPTWNPDIRGGNGAHGRVIIYW
jgi:hypothetical protein